MVSIRKYHYLVIFLIGFLILMPFMLRKLYMEYTGSGDTYAAGTSLGSAFNWKDALFPPIKDLEEDKKGFPWKGEAEEGLPSYQEKTPEQVQEAGSLTEIQGDGTSGGMTSQVQESDEMTAGGSGIENIAGKPEAQEGEGTSGAAPEEVKAATPEEYFQDALFIGDSRTMGLAEYGGIGDAAVFANTGMSIYRLYTLKNAFKEYGLHLEDVLAQKQYSRIFFMLGINELGYDFDTTIARYEEEVLKLHQAQPEAEIILEANLHVTAEKSAQDKIFNNENINRFNEGVRQIAERYGFSYIDVNVIFDDENGALSPVYTGDEVHVLGKYYQQWADWIWKEEFK